MAMDIAQPMRFTVDIDTGLVTTPQRTHLNYGDINANRIIVAVVRGKTPVDLTGVSATGSFYRPGDGARIPLEGDISANEASVTLIDHCYAAEGQYEAEVKLTQGSVTRTVLSITGYVHRAGSDVLVDVTGTVPSLDALLAQIQATKDAAAAANTAAGNANAATTKANNAANTANSAASNADAKAQAAQTAADAANAAEQNWSNGTAANATKLNGKSADEYLLKANAFTMELLWQNGAPSSSFGAHLLSEDELSLADLDKIIIVFDSVAGRGVYCSAFMDLNVANCETMAVDKNGKFLTRKVLKSRNQLEFAHGYKYETYGTYASDDSVMIPVFIYGVKGVSE